MEGNDERDLTVELALCRAAAGNARRRVVELTTELDATNRGVVALRSELDSTWEAAVRALTRQEVLADHDRIARRLHDQIIQRVFSASLALQSVLGLVTHPYAVKRLRATIGALDETLRELRAAIITLEDQPPSPVSLSLQLFALTAQAKRELGLVSILTFEGPVDTPFDDEAASDLLIAVRTVLEEVAGQVRDARVEVAIDAGSELVLRIRHTRPGTDLEWRVPLPRSGARHRYPLRDARS